MIMVPNAMSSPVIVGVKITPNFCGITPNQWIWLIGYSTLYIDVMTPNFHEIAPEFVQELEA